MSKCNALDGSLANTTGISNLSQLSGTINRNNLGDNKKTETESLALTPTTIAVQLQYNNAEIFSLHDKNQSSSILVENTDYTFDTETGVISLLYTPQDGSVLTATYYYYAFSQAELEDLQASYGTNGAVVEALRWLIADSARLHDYSRGATSESLSQIIKNYRDWETPGIGRMSDAEFPRKL